MCVCIYILQIYIQIINLYKFLLIFCILRYEDASDDDLKNRVLPDCKKRHSIPKKLNPSSPNKCTWKDGMFVFELFRLITDV